MIGFFKLVSPSVWAIVALTVAFGVQTARIHSIEADLKDANLRVTLQNLNIEAHRQEAYLMGQSLKKHKAEAIKLRAAIKKEALCHP